MRGAVGMENTRQSQERGRRNCLHDRGWLLRSKNNSRLLNSGAIYYFYAICQAFHIEYLIQFFLILSGWYFCPYFRDENTKAQGKICLQLYS